MRRRRQSKRVRRDSDSRILEIDEKGDNCSLEEADNTIILENSKYTNTAQRQLPVYNDNVASALGVKYSSYVSRSGKLRSPIQRKTCSQTGYEAYNIFEDTVNCDSVDQLPHPSKLFGKCKAKSVIQRKRERPNSVECHISQLQTKKAKMDEQIERFKVARENNSSSSLLVSGNEELHDVSRNQDNRDLSWFEGFYSTQSKKRSEPKLKRRSEE